MNKQTIKCAVFALNSNGEPDVFYVNVTGPEECIDNGDHYDAAKDAAALHGFDPVMACDENDPAWAQLALAGLERPDESVTLSAA
jgi:hypothetical protein